MRTISFLPWRWAALLCTASLTLLQAASIDTLYNTGVNDARELLGEDQVDPHYTLSFSPDAGAPGPEAFTLQAGFPVGPWLDEGPDSRWIAPQPDQATGNSPGVYTFTTSFELSDVDPASAEITGRMTADNSVVAVRLNGWDMDLTSGGFNAWTSFTIPTGSPFQDGPNTLEFDVSNAGDTANPIGFRVEMTGRATAGDEAPQIFEQPQSRELLAGSTVTLTVEATGTPPLSYQWLLDDEPIDGAIESTYTLSNITTDDAGSYTVTVSNDFGDATSDAAILDVLEPFPGIYNTGVDDNRTTLEDYMQDPHYILTANPTDPGVTATFVQDSFLFPIVAGPWLANSPDSKWIGPLGETGGAAPGEYRYQLELDLTGFDPATAFLAGSWAADDGGALFLNGADTGFTSGGFGSLTEFRLEAGFVPGINVLEFRVNNGAEGYTGLRVENLRGTAEPGEASERAPEIVTHPQDATRALTQTHTFRVVADGTQPFTYEWFHNGDLIEGADENSLTLTRLLPGDSGTYTARVSNNLGSADSNPAELTLVQPELGVFATGVDSQGNPLPLGEPDPHYLLIASADPAFPPHTTYAAAGAPIPPWLENTENSQWITVRPSGVDAAPGSYTYRLIFEVSADETSTAAITAQVSADDGTGGAVFLNGQSISVTSSGFATFDDLVIPEGSPFVEGFNTLDFVVSNGGSSANPTGLRVENIEITGVTLPPQSPVLSVSLSGEDLRITWPAAASGFTLQETSSLPGGWTDSNATINVEEDQHVVIVPVSDDQRFFRLAQ